MDAGSPYSLVKEMLETPGILRRFDPARTAAWAREAAAKKRLFLTGEGSSRIFPAKNAISLALQRGLGWQVATEGARQAAEYDLSDFTVIGASNSGQTKELIALFEKLKRENVPCYGITPSAGSKLTQVADACILLDCGAEKAVAATKSVVEQALVYQSLLAGDEWKNQAQAADYCEGILSQAIAPGIIDGIKSAPVIYFSGRNDGVAEELTLKTNEIVRRKSDYLEGTYALHGIEEVMQDKETVVLIEPFKEEIDKYRDILAVRAGMNVITIASFDTPLPTVKIPFLKGFDAYMRLLAGWNILVAAGIANGIDLDRTIRARKIGNAVQG